MAGLAEPHCVPCRGGVPPLTADAIAPLLAQLDGWRVVDDHHLERRYPLANFAEALDFVNRIGAIAEAQALAQAEMVNPAFDSQNPHFKSRFASLASLRNAVVPVLAKHGITMTQDWQTTDVGIACYTILTHKSGQRMTFGPLVMPATKQDAQGFGSAATYARRYALMAAAGVVGDDDDDANAAVRPVQKAEKAKPPAGYEEWRADMGALADEGLEAFQEAWKKSDPAFRIYATNADHDWWNGTKARAA